MAGSLRKHDWLVDKICVNPCLIGLEPRLIQAKSKHYLLIDDGRVVTAPDVSFKYSHNVHFVEVKSDPNAALYSKGMKQLEKIINWCEVRGVCSYDVSLVMPHANRYSSWKDMLDELDIYKMGDSFKSPSGNIL